MTIALTALFLGERPAAAAADVGFQTLAVTGVDMPDLSARFAVGGVAHRMWNPLPPLGLGLRVSLSATTLPYGNNDGEPSVGERSGYNSGYLHESLTVLPSLALAARWQPGDGGIRAGATAGFTFLVSSEMGGWSLLPMPTFGIELDARIPRTDGLRARAGVDYIGLPSWGLVLAHLGLIWDL